jgi:hypothetical protein
MTAPQVIRHNQSLGKGPIEGLMQIKQGQLYLE